MKVALIAHTALRFSNNAMAEAGYQFHDLIGDEWVREADELAEFAGRLCYLSWKRPNPKTRTNQGYLANIINQGHFSVLEHASATFYIEGVSRSLTHELITHRHLSKSQVSQRYVDGNTFNLVIPPDLADVPEADSIFQEIYRNAFESYRRIAELLAAKGLSHKRIRQAARAALPNATETRLVVTGNFRAWREVIAKRNSPAADEEIHELAGELLRQLKEIAPNTFQDME